MQKSNERLRRLSLPISMGLIVNSQSGTTRTKRIHSANTANPAEQSTTTTATTVTISTVESKETRLMSPTWILWKWLFGLPPLHQLIALPPTVSTSLFLSLFISLSLSIFKYSTLLVDKRTENTSNENLTVGYPSVTLNQRNTCLLCCWAWQTKF